MEPNLSQDLEAPVTKFCLELEKDRRTSEGRIRNERDFREHFFPYDDNKARDRLLKFLPKEVRGPIIASWGIRGRKAANRDDDARVLAVVHDALVAGDINDGLFEEGLSAETVIRWVELADFWRFWRGGKHTKYSIQRALETGYQLGLFDARWFFDVLEGGGGKLRGTDVLAEGLSKTELADWIKHIHESGDGSPKGMLAALGWPTLVAKTANTVLLAVIDAFAQKNGLVKDRFLADAEQDPGDESKRTPTDRGSERSIPPTPSDPAWGAQTPIPEPVHSSGEEEALLRELGDSSPSEEDGEWLENPAPSQSEDALGDELDVDLDSNLNSQRPLQATGAIAELLHSEGEDEPSGDGSFDSPLKPTLPGLPSSLSKRGRTSSTPPPLPDSPLGKRR